MKHGWAVLAIHGAVVGAAIPARSEDGPPRAGHWSARVQVTATIDGRRMTGSMLVYFPRSYAAGRRATPDPAPAPAPGKHPLVIALHGWNHTPETVRDHSQLARWADAYNLVIAVPAMTTTVYETRLYPQTRRSWAVVPGARWVGEAILPYLRANYAVSADRARTAVIGYSTGGRGAVLLAQAYPQFRFAGAVSGTFDLMRLHPGDGEYQIHAAVYGPRSSFKDRWERDNCIAPSRLAQLTGTQLFIAHGRKDTVVSSDQLEALRDALRGNTAIKADFVLSPDGEHTWAYWSSQSEPMFRALAAALDLPAP
jgi:S-formylglutathione hydrolase FrmB